MPYTVILQTEGESDPHLTLEGPGPDELADLFEQLVCASILTTHKTESVDLPESVVSSWDPEKLTTWQALRDLLREKHPAYKAATAQAYDQLIAELRKRLPEGAFEALEALEKGEAK